MKKPVGLILTCLLALLSASCGRGEKTDTEVERAIDSIPLLVTQIQRCSRLYTTEYRIHKLVSCESNRQISGFGISFDLNVFGDRKIIIPINATLKGYIDMNQVREHHIERKGEKITVTLPDPAIMMTSTEIDHENIKEYVTGFRGLRHRDARPLSQRYQNWALSGLRARMPCVFWYPSLHRWDSASRISRSSSVQTITLMT